MEKGKKKNKREKKRSKWKKDKWKKTKEEVNNFEGYYYNYNSRETNKRNRNGIGESATRSASFRVGSQPFNQFISTINNTCMQSGQRREKQTGETDKAHKREGERGGKRETYKREGKRED